MGRQKTFKKIIQKRTSEGFYVDMIVNHILMHKKSGCQTKKTLVTFERYIFTVAATQQKATLLVWEVLQSVTILTSFTK